jgi:ferric-dicitrate binding protein FerR (iron transport regulator)
VKDDTVTDVDESEHEAEPGERDLAELLALAGKRSAPDDRQMSRARAAAHAEWRRVVRRRRLPRTTLWILGGLATAVAVTVLLGNGGPSVDGGGVVPRDRLASVVTTAGPVSLVESGGTRHPAIGPGVALFDGDRIETDAAGRVAIMLDGGTTVKIDRASTVVFVSRSTLSLDAGAIYLDTGRDRAVSADVVVKTSVGLVQHVGTQFEIRREHDGVVVRVREGLVSIKPLAGQLLAAAGEAVRVSRAGAAERRSVATYGDDWAWVSEVLLPFTLEGATLEAFLDWAAREQGWKWRFESRSTRAHAAGTILHGSIAGLTVDEALETVVAACGLAFTRKGDLVIVSRLRSQT